MQQQNVKSATTAGLLGVFLGAFGAHNWYLGEKNKGIIHVCLMGGGLLLEIIAAAILPNTLNFVLLIQMAWLLTTLSWVGTLAMSASFVWGLVEGITILTQGDAGLARRGYLVAQPTAGYGYQQPNGPQNFGPQGFNQDFNQGYNGMPGFNGQPMQPMNGQMGGQPMGGQPQMNAQPPMNGQSPMGGQPMNNQMGNQPMGNPMGDQPMNDQPMNNQNGWENGQQ